MTCDHELSDEILHTTVCVCVCVWFVYFTPKYLGTIFIRSANYSNFHFISFRTETKQYQTKQGRYQQF